MSFTLLAFAFAGALFVGMLVLLDVGRRIGRRRLAHNVEGARAGLGVVEGSVFGLLGLLLAFTFSGATSRFDDRRQLIVQEVNAIGTAWLRIDLLPPDARPAIREGLRQYLDARLSAYRKLPDVEAAMQETAGFETGAGAEYTRGGRGTRDPSCLGGAAGAGREMPEIAATAAARWRVHGMLTREQMQSYRRDGYLLVENVLSPRELATLRQVTDELVAASGAVTEHDHVYDLEPTHTAQAPRVRRIKEPHNVHPAFRDIAFSRKVADILTPLLGPSGIRFQTGKLNMKSAGYGAAVEWHQDWAFYPHTNDDLLAIGIYLDDCGPDNGPLMVIPGSHTGPIADHHSGGMFCGAIDPPASGIDFSKAVMLAGPLGSMTIHHVRMVHGSALNTSDRPRRLLLFQYTAVDAFPLLGIPDWEKFNANIVTGEPTMVPRLTPVPVRIPLPVAAFQGSIYENQRTLANRYFDVYEEQQQEVR